MGVQQPIPYSIYFENVPTASAPAQKITVTDQLDANLDVRTFRLGTISIGDYTFQVPDNRSYYQGQVNLGPAHANLVLNIVAGLDFQAHSAFWILSATDPITGDKPQDPTAGLLPPDDDAGDGSGFVTYTILPAAGVVSGQTISNTARIVFEDLEYIDTNTVVNAIDAGIPTSRVSPLPPVINSTDVNFNVSWSGEDDAAGTGINNFDIYVADNGSKYSLWQSATTATSAMFEGYAGHTYSFYSLARDNAGNQQLPPTVPDTTVTISGAPVPVAQNQALATDKNTPLAIALQASGGNGNTLTYRVTTPPAHGALSGSGANLTFTPAAESTGVDSFTFIANDGSADSNVATVGRSITPHNQTPLAYGQSVSAVEEISTTITLTGDGNDPGIAQVLTFSVVDSPAHGTLSSFNSATGSCVYTPSAHYYGSDSFTFKVTDDAAAGLPANADPEYGGQRGQPDWGRVSQGDLRGRWRGAIGGGLERQRFACRI